MQLRYLLVGLCLALTGSVAIPATFVVNSVVDSHDADPGDGVAGDHLDPDFSFCTLRAAVEEAGALPGPDTILVPSGTGLISLTLGSLSLRDNGTVIKGVGGRTIVDGVGNPTNYPTFVIGSDANVISGLHVRRSRGDAIVILGAANRIGGSVGRDGLILTANGLDNTVSSAVRISGPEAIANVVAGNYIGLTPDGVTPDGNVNGVVLEYGASLNMVGGPNNNDHNIISGNSGYGIVIYGGAFDNQIAGNFIGPDSTGNQGPGNQLGGVLLLADSHDNLIGGDDLTQGNVISANQGNGISLIGADVTGNRIDGNLIGATASGRARLGNQGDGILVTDRSHDNLIGGSGVESGNIISGNTEHGVHLSGAGVTGNRITANWIGLARNGYAGIGNGWLTQGDGVLIDGGASRNTVGSSLPTERNVISDNYRFGVHLQGTNTSENLVSGNYIGLSFTGTSSLGNATGVGISDGARGNTIGGLTRAEGNVISGNRWDEFPYGCGVLIVGEGTQYNHLSGNIIGLDAQGLQARRNGSSGVVIGGGAQHNLIGGDHITDGNIISGNGIDSPIDGRAAGIHIFGPSTCYNRISGNLIGLDSTTTGVVGNRGHGVGIYSGAHHNVIGGDSLRQMNQIVGNEGAGVFMSGPETRSNLVRGNILRANASLGIDLRDSAQNGIQPPQITTVGKLYAYGPRLVTGRSAPPGARIDIYRVNVPDPSGAGEGEFYLAYTLADALGQFSFYLPSGPAVPIILTAVATDADNNSSEFSIDAYSPDATPVEESPEMLPLQFSLEQNYPNPFNASTNIVFSLPSRAYTRLIIYNILGQQVRNLSDQVISAGEHTVAWNSRDDNGEEVASGVYLYRLETPNQTVTRKMILLK